MTIVFFGTPAFAVPSLQRLFEAGFPISAVYTRPDRPAGRSRRPAPPPVKTAALERGLDVRQPESLRDAGALAEFAALQPQAAVAVAYGRILPREVLDVPPKGILNVHPSLLPRFRGASPIPAAILAGDIETGVTVFLMDEGTDTGPILSRHVIAISENDTTGTLTDRLAEVAADLLTDTLPRWLAGELTPERQDESLASSTPLLKKEHGEIDWSLPATDIWRRVRAYNPWPGAYTTLDGKLLHIWSAWPLPDGAATPGAVADLSDEQRAALPADADPQAFAVGTGDGLLAVLSVQLEGRRALPAGAFRRGLRDLIGRRLGA
ncbi:MAG: methionyl-tRNA formyltransferase [Dehalococcoidia bacterium]